MTVFPDFVLFFFSFFSYDFVFGRRKQRNENECTSTKNEKKWKNGNRWEDLCKMSNARRYMSALRETVKNETGERFRSRHKLFALHSTHRFRKRFSDLWVTVSVQLFCSFLSFRSLFSRVRFISSRRRIQPGSIHRYIPNDVEFFFIFLFSVDGKWLIAHTWFSSTISMIRSSIALLPFDFHGQEYEVSLPWITQFAHVQWSNVFVCQTFFSLTKNSDLWALLSTSLRFFSRMICFIFFFLHMSSIISPTKALLCQMLLPAEALPIKLSQLA